MASWVTASDPALTESTDMLTVARPRPVGRAGGFGGAWLGGPLGVAEGVADGVAKGAGVRLGVGVGDVVSLAAGVGVMSARAVVPEPMSTMAATARAGTAVRWPARPRSDRDR